VAPPPLLLTLAVKVTIFQPLFHALEAPNPGSAGPRRADLEKSLTASAGLPAVS
jgi:hypothetical protein